jgi:hypothetical protein
MRPQLHQRAANRDARNDFARDRTGRHPCRGFARRGTPTAAIIAHAIFGLISEIGVARAEFVADVGIVLGTLVDILDHQRDGRSRRHRAVGAVILEHAGEDLHLVRFPSLRCETGPPRPSLIQVDLNVLGLKRNVGRAAIDDASESRAMTFTEGGHPEHMAEAVIGHGV